jgi:hypothetical protein
MQAAESASKGLVFEEGLGPALDDLEETIDHYLLLETKLFRTARRLLTVARRVRRISDDQLSSIQEAAVGKKGSDKAALNRLAVTLDDILSDLSVNSIDAEVQARLKREVATVKRSARALR